ncbi:uncharacterized protein C6orf15 homolog [Sorex araneus]|uniref:uncharacterized protein C6orf15 homolog n=1 Tax=Sorex araneus TaxID=42254 RepID=UPI0024339EBD|nr:uncharacterized protein C6orf15 homolog [Sorex araneus]
MQGCVARRWAPLGLLLLCLHLPGLLSRSINAVEEKAPQHPGTDSPLPAQPPLTSPSNSEHPQPQPDPVSKDLTSTPLAFSASPSDGFQPAEGPEAQGWPLPEEMPFMDSWSSEDPWQMMMAADEDYAEEALPEELSFLSGATGTTSGSKPLSAGSSDTASVPLDSDSEHPSHSNMPGALEPTRAQSPFWSFINKIRQTFLSGRPCGILNPRVPVRGGGPGTGWGTRPMPNPVGIGGINNQYPGTGWGNINKIPGASWGNINKIPGASWGNINKIPGSSWGNINKIPGTSWGNINKIPGTSWGNINKIPGSSWGNINKIPGVNWGNINKIPGSSWGNINGIPGNIWGNINQNPGGIWGNINGIPGGIWGNINRLPGGIWGNINRLPGGIWGNINRLPGGTWGNINRLPGTSWGPLQPVINKLPPGVLRPPSSSLNIPAGLPQSKGPASE